MSQLHDLGVGVFIPAFGLMVQSIAVAGAIQERVLPLHNLVVTHPQLPWVCGAAFPEIVEHKSQLLVIEFQM